MILSETSHQDSVRVITLPFPRNHSFELCKVDAARGLRGLLCCIPEWQSPGRLFAATLDFAGQANEILLKIKDQSSW